MCILCGLSGSVLATPTPTPTITPTPSVTPTATNTLVYDPYATGQPSPTPDTAGCPETIPNIDTLDTDWARACSRCISVLTPTSPFNIPEYGITPNPIGTPNPEGYTPVPTLTQYVVPTAYIPPTSTLTLTPSITPTPTPSEGWCYTWDFTESAGGWYVTPSTAGEYESGVGFNDTYPPGFDGIYMTSPDWVDTGWITRLVVYTDLLAGEGLGHFLIRESDSLEEVCDLGGELTEDEDLELWAYGFNCDSELTSGEALEIIYDCEIGANCDTDVSIVRVHISGEDGNSPTGSSMCEGSPTPTPGPTSTPGATSTPYTITPNPLYTPSGVDCSVPVYDELDPVATLGDLDDLYVSTECYTIIPNVHIGGDTFLGIEIPEFVMYQFDLCFDYYMLPAITIFGIEIDIAWIMIVPVIFLMRRLFSF